MRSTYLWASLVGFSALASLATQACGSSSDSCAESGSCERLGEAGASSDVAGAAGASDSASEAGAAGEARACTTDAECDDGRRCNGVEACVAGTCRPGSAPSCDNASSCVEDTSLAPCSYSDPSAWLAYAADEDTPGVNEIYVVKEALIGKQTPIKVSGALAEGEQLQPFSMIWSPDRSWLVFQSANEQRTSSHTYVVSFANGRPTAPVEVAKGLPVGYTRSSFSGHGLLAQANQAAYLIPLNANGPAEPIQINAAGTRVTSAVWVQGGNAVLYTTDDGSVQVVSVTGQGVAPPQSLSNAAAEPLLAYDASSDGNWVIFEGTLDRRVFGVRAVAGETTVAIGNTDNVSASFSPDAHYLAFSVTGTVAHSTAVYVLDLQASALSPQVIEQAQSVNAGDSLGGWSADSTLLLYYRDPSSPNPDQKTPEVYAPATQKTLASPYPVSVRSYPVGISPKGAFIMQAVNDPTEVFTMNGTSSVSDFMPNAAGVPYYAVDFNSDGSQAVVCTGTSNDVDMSFADLRGAAVFPQLVHVPGEGLAAECYRDFAPDGKGFAYFRFAPDGSRVLYWVDSSKQVLEQPVPITRAGRARNYTWQP